MFTEEQIKKVNQLEVGDTFKNYPELCRYLDISPTGGKAKKCRIAELERYVGYAKEGNAFIITEVYDKPKSSKQKGRKKIDFPSYHVDQQYDKSQGVYKIVNYETKEIYIGSTNNFRNRFLSHSHCTNPLPTYNMLQNGAIFEIIEIMDDNKSLEEVRDRESYWIDYFRKEKSWVCVNSRFSKEANIANISIKIKSSISEEEEKEKVIKQLKNYLNEELGLEVEISYK